MTAFSVRKHWDKALKSVLKLILQKNDNHMKNLGEVLL